MQHKRDLKPLYSTYTLYFWMHIIFKKGGVIMSNQNHDENNKISNNKYGEKICSTCFVEVIY